MQVINTNDLKNFEAIRREVTLGHPVYLHHTGHMFGVGCDARDNKAIEKINQIKNRQSGKGYIVLIPDASWLEKMDVSISVNCRRLMEQYSPGNLTFVLPYHGTAFQHLAMDGALAIRIPTAFNLRKFIERLGTPIVSTSINKAGENPLDNLDDIYRKFHESLSFYVEEPMTWEPQPSTIMRCEEKLEILREGSIPESELRESLQKPLITFICTGNICRSPIAEYLLKDRIEKDGLELRSESAGFLPSGNAISKHSETLLRDQGINATMHRSTQINNLIIRRSWLLVVMTESHREQLLAMVPYARHKVRLLSEFGGNGTDIEDPYGGTLDQYRYAFMRIDTHIQSLIEYVNNDK